MGGLYSTTTSRETFRSAEMRSLHAELAAEKRREALMWEKLTNRPLPCSPTQYFVHPWSSLDGYIMAGVLIVHVLQLRQYERQLRRERLRRYQIYRPLSCSPTQYFVHPWSSLDGYIMAGVLIVHVLLLRQYERQLRREQIRREHEMWKREVYEQNMYKQLLYEEMIQREQMRCQQMREVRIPKNNRREEQEQHELKVCQPKRLAIHDKRAEKKLTREPYEEYRRKSERIQLHHAVLVAVLETERRSRRAFQISPYCQSSRTYNSGDPSCWRAKLRSVDATTTEFERIARLFRNTATRSNLTIVSIVCVDNPALFALYTLKREELTSRYGERNVSEKFLFHGTSNANKDSICVNNLDWRRYGTAMGHRLGKGISLSPSAKYASHYCDKRGLKTMFVFAVVVGPQCVGAKTMYLPPKMAHDLRYDSTKKADGSVVVKYDDHEFYPNYIITFN